MEVNVLSRKLIKPETPTPKSLTTYNLSFKDELSPPLNVSLLFFYPSSKPKQHHLEASLAKTLVQFYPLAGRFLKKEGIIDCSDEGAEFVEAEITGVNLTDLTTDITTEQLKQLLPRQCYEVDGATDPLLSIQMAELKSCAGLVLSVSVSHRIFDAYSIGAFVAAWSDCSSSSNPLIMPTFNSVSLFPGRNLNYSSEPLNDPTVSAKRFVFPKEAIASLRSKLKPKDGDHKDLSRVRVVSALIARALIRADRAKRREPRPCLIAQSVDMRDRTAPPLPKYSCGNLAMQSVVEIRTGADPGTQEIVDLIGDAVAKTVSDCGRILESAAHRDGIIDAGLNMMFRMFSSDVNVVFFSDWSKFGFDEVEFGWGKPVWVSVGPWSCKNIIVLMNNREGDGMEAWVHLDHDDMAYLHQDDDIKLYTT